MLHHGNQLTVNVGGSDLFRTHQGKKLPEKEEKKVYKVSANSQVGKTVAGLVTFCSVLQIKTCVFIFVNN